MSIAQRLPESIVDRGGKGEAPKTPKPKFKIPAIPSKNIKEENGKLIKNNKEAD